MKRIAWVLLVGLPVALSACSDTPRNISAPEPTEAELALGVQANPAQDLIVHFLDVEGDATLIINGESRVIIDGGRTTKRFATLIDSLGLNNSTIEAVILSHGHIDHYTGLEELFRRSRNITVKAYYENPSGGTGSKLRDSVNARVGRGELVYRSTYDPCGNGSVLCTLQLAGGAKLHLMQPMPTSHENNSSAPVKLIGPDSASFTMWLAGDAEQPAINWFDLHARYHVFPGMKVNVLKGNHHGNCGAITHGYIQHTDPDWVLFPTKNNTKGYVHTQTKDLLTSYGKPWYRTDGNGTITIVAPASGGGYSISVQGGVANMSASYDGTSSHASCNPIPPAIQRPTAVVNGPYVGNEGSDIQMTSAGTSDPNGLALSYRWDFGDGTTSTAANPKKRYTDDGTYAVRLVVSNPAGAADTATTTAIVANVPPTATFSAPSSIVEGSDYTLTLSKGSDVSIVDRETLEYALDCGLGAGLTPWSRTVTSITCPVQLDQRDPLTVRGLVRDKDGGEREYSRTMKVTNAAPVVHLAATSATTLSPGGTLSVEGSFTDLGVNDSPWTYTVTWGYKTTNATGTRTEQGTPITAQHTYLNAGTYSVQMTVRDKDGSSGKSAVITVVVQ